MPSRRPSNTPSADSPLLAKKILGGWNKKTLRIIIFWFFIALAVPTGILIYQAYSQLKWETFYQHRLMAEELIKRIDQQILQLVETENKRAFTEYTFLNISGDAQINFLQRSPLASHPVNSPIPGVVGYFQIDHLGDFSTPLLPHPIPAVNILRQDYGLNDSDFSLRQQTQQQIHRLLTDNRLLVQSSSDEGLLSILSDSGQLTPRRSRDDDPGLSQVLSATAPGSYELDAPSPQSGFDKLRQKTDQGFNSQNPSSQSLGRIKDLKLENRYRAKLAETENKSSKKFQEKQNKIKPVLRKEQNVLPVQAPQVILTDEAVKNIAGELEEKSTRTQVSIFESEVDAFRLAILGSGHFVLYRNSWRDGQRYIQGLLVTTEAFIDALLVQHFLQTTLADTSQLSIAHQGNVLKVLSKGNGERYLSSASELQGSLLLQRRLSAPLDDIELLFSVHSLPAGPGAVLINWLAGVLLLVLSGGLWLIYRLGLRQITLAEQQQNFVSAVSHELKTPLTSIRMYGEMLREGWAPEDKKRSYYDFIYEESERLSRLIDNVLQLARMTRNELQVEVIACPISQLMDTLRSKIASQIEHAGFELDIACGSRLTPALEQEAVLIDVDGFIQIMINLVDNAIKFSAASETRKIDIHCKAPGTGKVQFSVRDYGPGIEKDQMRKIFQLFYRSENELTRDTTGTGIGLALAHQLVQAMNGEIDVLNSDPGVEFRIIFPLA